MKWIVFMSYLATIPAANWLIGNVGTICIADGPCLIPVGFGLMAPSGVLMIGLALVLRDAVQILHGKGWAVIAVIGGSAVSFFIASPDLAIASASAFLLAEACDMAIYSPLRDRGWVVSAILFSGIVGSVVDSAVFLFVAFGSFAFITGQILGKVWMTIAAAIVLAAFIEATKE